VNASDKFADLVLPVSWIKSTFQCSKIKNKLFRKLNRGRSQVSTFISLKQVNPVTALLNKAKISVAFSRQAKYTD
jgi:hypothetical protein